MMEARIAWEFKAAPTIEQLRIRALRAGPDEPVKVHKFERELLGARPRSDDSIDDLMLMMADLGTCRPVGMGLGRIPITAIRDECKHRRMDAEATEITTRVLLHADAFYLAERAKKAGQS